MKNEPENISSLQESLAFYEHLNALIIPFQQMEEFSIIIGSMSFLAAFFAGLFFLFYNCEVKLKVVFLGVSFGLFYVSNLYFFTPKYEYSQLETLIKIKAAVEKTTPELQLSLYKDRIPDGFSKAKLQAEAHSIHHDLLYEIKRTRSKIDEINLKESNKLNDLKEELLKIKPQ